METKKVLLQLGTAIAATKIAKTVSGVELNDVLATIGLSRRRSHLLEGLGLVAVGAVVGAAAAFMFAPASGRETRRRLANEASKLGDVAKDALREQKDEALRSLSQVANGARSTAG